MSQQRTGTSMSPFVTTGISTPIDGTIVMSVALISPGTRAYAQVIEGNLNWSTMVEGSGADYMEIRKWGVEYGEFFTEQDVKGAAKVCVLGRTAVDNLFPDSSPVGRTIRIRNVPFRVLGVLIRKGQNALGQDQDDIIIAPYTTVKRRLTWYPYLRMIVISATSPADPGPDHRSAPDAAQDRPRRPERFHDPQPGRSHRRRVVGHGNTDDPSREHRLRLARRGGDRHHEHHARVGHRTHPRDRRPDGRRRAGLISHLAHWPTIITAFSLILSFAFSFLIGLFFGYYPARKAAFLDLIEALRYE